MKQKVAPTQVPLTGETIAQIECFDPRVIPARPAKPDANPPEPAYLGTVSLIVRFYDTLGNEVLKPLRSDKTALTPEQYAAWTDQVTDDVQYFTDCLVANLGLTKVT